MRATFTGVGTALVTPFTKTGALDEAAVRRLARRQVDAGVHFLVPCGTTGETPTLSAAERRARRRDRGRGGRGPRARARRRRRLRHARSHPRRRGDGAAPARTGMLSVTPYYNKPTPEGLYQHYKAIAESTSLPIIVYNVPGRTGCNVDPATLARLATIPNIVGVKEASGNMTQMAEIVPRRARRLSSCCRGDDALTLPLMAIGGRGIISVASNEVPAEMVQMVEAAERGDFATARRWHDKLLPLMQVNFIESSPGPVKFAMAAMGLCEESYRLPMVPPKPASQEKILARAPRVRPADRRGQRRARGVVAAARSPVTRSFRPPSRVCSPKASARTRRPRATRSSSCSARSAAATSAPPSPTPRRRPAGASTRGSSRASCSASASATSWTSRPITASGRSTTRTR